MIYFAQDSGSGHVKIGRAADPWRRLTKMQSDCPGAIAIVALEAGDADREAELHARFSEHRLRGEWFAPAADLMAHVVALGPPSRPVPNSISRAFWGGMSDAGVSRESGVSQPFLSEIRGGSRRPSPEVAITLQRATGKSAVDLVFGDLASEARSGA